VRIEKITSKLKNGNLYNWSRSGNIEENQKLLNKYQQIETNFQIGNIKNEEFRNWNLKNLRINWKEIEKSKWGKLIKWKISKIKTFSKTSKFENTFKKSWKKFSFQFWKSKIDLVSWNNFVKVIENWKILKIRNKKQKLKS